MSENRIEKETRIKKAQPIKFKSIPFAKGFKVEVEFNFSPYDSTDIDQLIKVDSELRTSLENFIVLIEATTKGKLLHD